MARPKDMLIGLTAIGAATGLPSLAHAQEDNDRPSAETVATDSILADATVTLKVDGMVCPFCAYGLERQLRKIAAVDSVLVRISDGVVQIREKRGQEITDKALGDAVTRAGFTLREIQRKKQRMNRAVLSFGILLSVPELLSAQGLPFHTQTALTTAFEERGLRVFSALQRRGDATVLASPLVVLPFAPHQRVTTSVTLPIVSKWMNESGGTGDVRYSNAGLGDVSISLKWAFFGRDYFQGTTRFAAIAAVTLPTGSTSATLNGATVAPRPLQLGAGAVSAGLTLVGTMVRGRWGVNADLGHLRSASDDGYLLGAATRYNVAIGFRIPKYIATLRTKTFQFYLEWNGLITGKNRNNGNALSNSGGHVAYLSPAVQWVVLPQLLFEASLQVPVIQDFNGTQQKFGVRPAVGGRFLFF